jgi:tRNA nucleotidyltransferase (CCA-adding enzyme)
MRESIREVLRTLTQAGYEAVIVGGYVRDTLLRKETNDCDIATSATPDQVEALFSHVHSQAKMHGTISVVCQGDVFEITTFRHEGTYDDYRRPSSVTYTTKLNEDLARRDFTINALAMNEQGIITDLYGGQKDLEAGILRAIGDPIIRMHEDALRILRAIRFQSQLGVQFEPTLFAAMKECAPLIAHLSLERVRDELTKLLAGEHLAMALTQYQALALPGLPRMFLARRDLSLVEQCSIAHLSEGYDASRFPWTKEERALYGRAQQLPKSVPTAVELYRMSQPLSMIRIGAAVYRWDEAALMQTHVNLLIHSRSELAVSGHDVVALGLKGVGVEAALLAIESAVILQEIPNEQAAILSWMKEQMHEHH